MFKRTISLLLVVGLLPSSAGALTSADLKTRLSGQMSTAGPYSGAYVFDIHADKALFAWKADTKRIPASVEKLYTTSTLLLKDTPETTLTTRVLSAIPPDSDGIVSGNIYLRGSGDPTFSSSDVGKLAQQIADLGTIEKIKGRVYGDESAFDSVRGVPDSGWAISPYVGPLSGLTFNRNFAGNRYSSNPAKAAAQALTDALQHDGIKVTHAASTGKATTDSELATLDSPPLSKLAALTNKPSDNFLAETLLKGLGARHGGDGSTSAGAAVVKNQLAQFGIYPTVVDGSGLSRSNRTSPRQIVTLLKAVANQSSYQAFKNSLAVAGRDGTLAKRMRGTAAKGRCHAKTGTLSNVSTLAGYCDATGGHTIAFAFMMNATSPYFAKKRQDKMATAIAKYDS